MITKSNLLNLIKYHAQEDNAAFDREVRLIAKGFQQLGDEELALYALSLNKSIETWTPQSEGIEIKTEWFEELKTPRQEEHLYLTPSIKNEVNGVLNAIRKNIGVNRFLFYGEPGTGKTETVKQFGRILNRPVLYLNSVRMIDSKLGASSKNLLAAFKEMESIHKSTRAIFLFDELDSIALTRNDPRDLREMGRVSTTFLKALDSMGKDICLIGTTNLKNLFDEAILRRFDAAVCFDRYPQEDLKQIALELYDNLIKELGVTKRNKRIFSKILNLWKPLPMPGQLKNLLRKSIAFSDPNDEDDILRVLLKNIEESTNKHFSPQELSSLGFSLRDLETLFGESRMQISRALKQV